MQNSPTTPDVLARVKSQYERFPFPGYPFFANLSPAQAYASSARFSAQICISRTQQNEESLKSSWGRPQKNGSAQVLIMGCGDTAPLLHAAGGLGTQHWTCVDLSMRSIQRLRLRTFRYRKQMLIYRSDLDQFLSTSKETFDHIDAYGVLHHLPSPSTTLALLSSRVGAQATMRVMIYNNYARKWIHRLQSAFRLLRVNVRHSSDMHWAKHFLSELVKIPSELGQALHSWEQGRLRTDSELVDTFFHEREVRQSLANWLRLFETHGWQIQGLLDHGGELDDLPNPLHCMPSIKELEKRIKEGMLRGNFELFFCRDRGTVEYATSRTLNFQPLSLAQRFWAPPPPWFDYPETEKMDWRNRQKLYWLFQDLVSGASSAKLYSQNIAKLPLALPTLKRLARVGAVLPTAVSHIPQLHDPLVELGLAKVINRTTDPQVATRVIALVCQRLDELDLNSPRRYRLVLNRLGIFQNANF